MATSNKDRQAAFKNRMRERGLAQRPFWVSPEQEAEIKAFLSADHLRLNQAQALLDVRTGQLDERERALAARERRLAEREESGAAPAVRKKPTTATASVDAPGKKQMAVWTNKLVRAMTTHQPWDKTERVEIDTVYTIEQRRVIAANLNKSTKATATKLGQLAKELSDSGYDLLSPAETRALEQMKVFLQGLGEATGAAYTRTKNLSKQLSADEERRQKVVSQAMRDTGLASMSDMEALFWRLHQLTKQTSKQSIHDRDYDLRSLGRHKLDSFDSWSLQYDMRAVRDNALSDIRGELNRLLKAQPELESCAAEWLTEWAKVFGEKRDDLAQQHRDFITHVQALLTADELEKASKHGKS